MIAQGNVVTLHYTLRVDGDVVDSSRRREPLRYVHGSGEILPAVEDAVGRMDRGDRRQVEIPPERAYGPRLAGAVRRVPREAFDSPDRLMKGARVTGHAQGRTFEAVVQEVGLEEITLDFNHPLAGKTLVFEIEVLDVAAA